MLTMPNEIVPLQMARGARADFAGALSDLSLTLRAVFGAIPNILNSVRAVGGLAARSVGRGLPRRLECAAQVFGEPARAGNEGTDLGNSPLAAARCGGLDRDRPPGAAPGRLAARDHFGVPGAY